jgi:hypothetical protein
MIATFNKINSNTHTKIKILTKLNIKNIILINNQFMTVEIYLN